MFGPRDVRIEDVPDSTILKLTDAILHLTYTSICGTDLWPYRGYDEFGETGNRMGLEFIGLYRRSA